MNTNISYSEDEYTTEEELDYTNEVFIETDKIINNENYNSISPLRNLNDFDKYLDIHTPKILLYLFGVITISYLSIYCFL